MGLPTALTAFLALCATVLAAVALGLPNWTKYRTLAGVSGNWGLWDWTDGSYCWGWILATIAMSICTCVFAFSLLIAAILVLMGKATWKSKKLRLLMFCLALMAFLFSILTICFYIAFHEWPPCLMNGSRNHWNTAYEYTKYDVSFILACVACGLLMLACCTAAWAVAKTPKPPAPKVLESEPEAAYVPEYPEYPEYTEYAYYTEPAPVYAEEVQYYPVEGPYMAGGYTQPYY